MIRRLIAVLSFTLLLGNALAALAEEAHGPSLALAQFQSQLSQLDAQVADLSAHPEKAEALRKSLPPNWTVTGGRFPVEVSAKFLDQALTDFQKQAPGAKKVTLRELHTRLTTMQSGLAGFTTPETADAAMRKRLDDILAAREFSSVHPPSVFEVWMEKLRAWLQEEWDKLFRALNINPPEFTWIGRIFVWLVIATGASVLGIWLYRIYRRKPPAYTREVIPFAPSSKSWRRWLAEAREHASHGDWREAIHLAYWASVSYLEASGLWIPDRARTPREYLKAIAHNNPKKPPFTALTQRFESIWYGSREAGQSDFDATLTELEKLGCQ
jgi:Domain of unknown function (DUF4129)